MKTVCVLMSTYNGEAFVKEQIDSVLEQKDVNVLLLVRDDGSGDSTISILEAYEREGCLQYMRDQENLGPACSFMKLLYNSPDADYYAFADQDDIWLSEKLIQGIKMLGDTGSPCLYCSNQMIYQKGEVRGMRIAEKPNLGLVNAICANTISGCTMIINKALRDLLIDERHRPSDECLKKRMHDTWIIAVAEAVGSVIYDHRSFIHYRIHESNTVGLKSTKLDRLKSVLKDSSKKHGRSCLAKELLKIEHLDDSKREIIEAFAERSFKRLVKNKDIKRECNEKRILFDIKAFLRWE